MSSSSAQTGTLTVVQWNVYHSGLGTDKVRNHDRQITWIAAQSPDIVSMNEVLAGDVASYTQKLNQASGQTWTAFHIKAQSDGTGNLILSRYPVVGTKSYLMKANDLYTRGIAEATIDIGGRTVSFFSTHLDNAGSTARPAQVGELLQFMAGFPEPRILAGDFNAAPTAPEMQPLFAGYFDSWESARLSNSAFAYPPANPVSPVTWTQWTRIDYVMYSDGLTGLSVTGSQIPDMRDLSNTNVLQKVGTTDDLYVRPSDHNMVVTTLQVQSVTPSGDTTPPVVSLYAPGTGSGLSGVVTLHADAQDTGTGVSKVSYLVDGQYVGTARAFPFDVSWDTALVTNGSHSLQAMAVDGAGNSALSAVVPIVVGAPTPPGASEVVLYAAAAPVVVGRWSVVADSTAAGQSLLQNTDLGAAKLTAARSTPTDYFEMTFDAVAGKPYRLWMRGKALKNSYNNDSVFVQFSDAVTSTGAPAFQIGTTASAEYNLEDCSGCGISGWGWQDNGWGVGVLGPAIYFKTTGTHTLRVQAREDGLGIDQIVLSSSAYLTSAPGALKNDTVKLAATTPVVVPPPPPPTTCQDPTATNFGGPLPCTYPPPPPPPPTTCQDATATNFGGPLPCTYPPPPPATTCQDATATNFGGPLPCTYPPPPPPPPTCQDATATNFGGPLPCIYPPAAPPPGPTTGPGDVLIYAASAATFAGRWSVVADSTAAGGSLLQSADLGAAKVATPAVAPADYFEVSFNADANRPYRLWIRGKALKDSYNNDSIYVQFSDAIASTGAPTLRIGTTSAASVILEDCSGCNVKGWGWQDNGYGTNVLGPTIVFATTGLHTIRIQTREDGLGIDQILLSPSKFLTVSPGAVKSDTVILR